MKTKNRLPQTKEGCEKADSWRISDMIFSDEKMILKFEGEDSLDKATLIVKAPEARWWTSSESSMAVYP